MVSRLNLGCGLRFHPDWTNLDVVSHHPSVRAHNVCESIPFDEASFDVVYHSHLLEHLTRTQADAFLRECRRVLKPGGTLRVVVPDLEQIARLYLKALEAAQDGNGAWDAHYEWMMLELLDQTVRSQSGGEMACYLLQKDVPNRDFILQRLGAEARRFFDVRESSTAGATTSVRTPTLDRAKRLAVRAARLPREWIVRWLLGSDYAALQLGRFRRQGEIHQWMYDRHSLAKLLRECGFENPVVRTPTASAVPGWSHFCLDTEPDGTIYKPDSLYMEAGRPCG